MQFSRAIQEECVSHTAGKLLLHSIFELKIQRHFALAAAVAQNGGCLTRVMIAVVKEKNDFSADLLLQPASRHNFSE